MKSPLLTAALACALAAAGLANPLDQNAPPPASPGARTAAGVDADRTAAPVEAPPLDLPAELRAHNYAGGSCLHASLITVLRWQGLAALADWWRANYWGAEAVEGLARKAKAAGVRVAWTTDGDADLLEWASRTRRGAAIHYFANHAVTFAGYLDGKAWLIDNNRPDRLIAVDKETFLARWRGYGGRALTPVYTPEPAAPY